VLEESPCGIWRKMRAEVKILEFKSNKGLGTVKRGEK
jgi:hypothetical protein